jgi:hypothetical protein
MSLKRISQQYDDHKVCASIEPWRLRDWLVLIAEILDSFNLYSHFSKFSVVQYERKVYKVSSKKSF